MDPLKDIHDINNATHYLKTVAISDRGLTATEEYLIHEAALKLLETINRTRNAA